MPLKKNLIGSGVAPLAAQNTVGTVTSALTATGSTSQANSLLLTDTINNITAGAAATGVRLPPDWTAGDSMVIGNSKTDTLFVYPPVGGSINGGTTDAKIDILTLHAGLAVCINGLAWVVVYNV